MSTDVCVCIASYDPLHWHALTLLKKSMCESHMTLNSYNSLLLQLHLMYSGSSLKHTEDNCHRFVTELAETCLN